MQETIKSLSHNRKREEEDVNNYSPSESSMRIAIIDFSEIARRAIGEFLERLGHKVQGYETAGDLCKHSGNNRFDMVLVEPAVPNDMLHEVISGIHGVHPEAHIIIMSHSKRVLPASEALSLNVFGYMTKPVSLSELEFLVIKSSDGRGGD